MSAEGVSFEKELMRPLRDRLAIVPLPAGTGQVRRRPVESSTSPRQLTSVRAGEGSAEGSGSVQASAPGEQGAAGAGSKGAADEQVEAGAGRQGAAGDTSRSEAGASCRSEAGAGSLSKGSNGRNEGADNRRETSDPQSEEPDWGTRFARKAADVAQRALLSRMARELLIIIGGYFLYSLIRNAAPAQEALAIAHAHEIIALQDSMGIGIELDVNRFFDRHTPLAVFANYFYAIAFSLSTVVTLVVLWRGDWNVFRFHRTVLVTMTAGAMFTYWLYPLAPPRLLPGAGYIDTFIKYNTWGRFHVSSDEQVSNQFAAMPSMHTGWAVWAAVALWCISAKWWVRVLATLLPVVTVVVIVGTANHFVLDAVAGLAYYLAALGIVLAFTRWRRRRGRAKVAYARVTFP